MSRGYRGILFALVGWLTLSAQAPQPKAEPERAKAAERISEPRPAGAPVPVEIVNQPTEPEGYQDPCRYDQGDNRSDLCAQWTAANGAASAAYYAGWQLWAAAAGMAGLLVTIWLTSRAVRVARQSVAVAQDTAKRQLRAYIGINQCSVVPIGATSKDPGRAHFKLRNFGQTPAIDLASPIGYGWSRYIETRGTAPPSKWHYHKEEHPSELPPTAEILRSSDIPSAVGRHQAGFEDGTKALWIELTLSYLDIYGTRYRQRVTFYVRGERYKAGDLHVAEYGSEKSEKA